MLGLDNDTRREFPDLVLRALLPAALAADCPALIAADWLEEHGDHQAGLVLRQSTSSLTQFGTRGATPQ